MVIKEERLPRDLSRERKRFRVALMQFLLVEVRVVGPRVRGSFVEVERVVRVDGGHSVGDIPTGCFCSSGARRWLIVPEIRRRIWARSRGARRGRVRRDAREVAWMGDDPAGSRDGRTATVYPTAAWTATRAHVAVIRSVYSDSLAPERGRLSGAEAGAGCHRQPDAPGAIGASFLLIAAS